MAEFFESSRRTLAELVDDIPPERHDELLTRFTAIRPIVETGWEMVVLLGLLVERPPARDSELRDEAGWVEARDAYLRATRLEQAEVARAFDEGRVRWIERDPQSWLALHRLYPGIAAWLRRLLTAGQPVVVLSTKGKEFLDAILAAHDIRFPPGRVIGKAEPRRAKWEVLRELAAQDGVPPGGLWFVEDRLPTLLELRRRAPDLAAAGLFLADWGYVFPDRDPAAARAAGIPVLDLETAVGPFSGWLDPPAA
jgi:phosphoglycolate phosphatase-like HAD superfamily hydrolase